MNHIWSVFRKDGIELLRDRRTLFVNVILPVLIYPVMLIFLIQVYQLTQANRPPPPLVGLAQVDDDLRSRLPTVDSTAADAGAGPDHDAGRTTAKEPEVIGRTLTEAEVADLLPLLERLDAAATAHDAATKAEPATRETAQVELHAARAPVLDRLRATGLSAVIAGLGAQEDRHRLLVAVDDADPQYDRIDAELDRILSAWKRRIVEQRLSDAGLPLSTIEPVERRDVGLAPPAQSARMRLAGIIPLLLVIMAVSGAFHPALDLIAGERERGTLETLLTWPVRRGDLFLGKLLVTIVAGVVAVVLNLCSLGLTFGLAGAQLAAAGGGGGGAGFFAAGIGTLVLSFIALLPLIVTLSAVSLALAGFAASSKEAQNYLSPLFLVVTIAAAVAMVPDARPSLALDLIPITGPVLALKEALRASEIPWLHLGLSTATSMAVAAVVVTWSVRLLDQESFRYPGLVRAGWGRWCRFRRGLQEPGGLEALGLFAACAALFLLVGPQLQDLGTVAQTAGPLLLCLGLPVLVYAWAGAYRPRALFLGPARGPDLGRGILAIPLAIAASVALGNLQPAPPPSDEQTRVFQDLMQSLSDQGGALLLVAVLALAPGICEELLCRGPLLAGLRRGIGPVGAVLVSSFCFAILHLSPYRFLPQFVLGIFLAALTLRAGSVWPAVLVHIGHNAVLVLLSGSAEATDEALLSDPLLIAVLIIALAGLAILARPLRGSASAAPPRP